jgi:probable HAF family extracellular repeat protein
MWHPSRLRDPALGSAATRSLRACRRTPRRRSTTPWAQWERLEDRQCLSGYSITQLDPLPGDTTPIPTVINDVNGSGQVQITGYSQGVASTHALLWQKDSAGVRVSSLGTLGGTFSYANGLNDAGQVVGDSWVDASGTDHAFLWQAGLMTDLGTLGGPQSLATSINASGQIVGMADTTPGVSHGFLWQTGVMTDLGTLGGPRSRAYSVNDANQVVGDASTAGGADHAFLWRTGVGMTDLGTLPGGTYSIARAVNGSGQVVGYGDVRIKGLKALQQHAFLWQNGVMIDLGTLVAKPRPSQVVHSLADDVSDTGQVIGMSNYIPGDESSIHAFLWQNGVMTDLNAQIPGGSGWVLGQANGINRAGQVVGTGTKGGFLLTPTAAAASRRAAAWPAIASPATAPGTTPSGTDDTGSFPQGALGAMPETAPWVAVGSPVTRRRHSLGVPVLLATALDPDGLEAADR